MTDKKSFNEKITADQFFEMMCKNGITYAEYQYLLHASGDMLLHNLQLSEGCQDIVEHIYSKSGTFCATINHANFLKDLKDIFIIADSRGVGMVEIIAGMYAYITMHLSVMNISYTDETRDVLTTAGESNIRDFLLETVGYVQNTEGEVIYNNSSEDEPVIKKGLVN